MGVGLIRTLGGWFQVIALRKSRDEVLCDEGILGKNGFVERIISEADNRMRTQLSINERKINAYNRIFSQCRNSSILNFVPLSSNTQHRFAHLFFSNHHLGPSPFDVLMKIAPERHKDSQTPHLSQRLRSILGILSSILIAP